MKKTVSANLCLLSIFVLAGCASTPDPAEICTSEWIAPRADRAVMRIEKRAKSSINTLRDVSESWAQGKTPGPIQLFSLSRAMKSLENELTNGQGIRDLKTVARTCNDPDIISDSMRDLLARQGVSDNLIAQIESTPIYQNLLDEVTR